MQNECNIRVLVMRMQNVGRKKQARSNKQQCKATQHTKGGHFSKRIMYLGWDSNLRHSKQSALPAELPRQLYCSC